MQPPRLPRIAHGLFTWRDGRTALEAALASTAGHVDELIVADGLIDGVDPRGAPWFSDLGWLADCAWLPGRVPIASKQWRSLSAACSWILAQARLLDCDWLLYVDGDQELHNPDALRPWLDLTEQLYAGIVAVPAALPILRCDPIGFHPCPWQLVNVRRVSRYIAGCFVVELQDGSRLSLAPNGANITTRAPSLQPWISHHPERRPAGRHAHRLGELETVLEPPPLVCAIEPAVLEIPPVADAPDAAYMCPDCGARYQGPGVCVNDHPAVELQKVADVEQAAQAAAADSAPAADVPAADAPTVEPANGTEAVDEPAPEPGPDTATEPAPTDADSNTASGTGSGDIMIAPAVEPDQPAAEPSAFERARAAIEHAREQLADALTHLGG